MNVCRSIFFIIMEFANTSTERSKKWLGNLCFGSQPFIIESLFEMKFFVRTEEFRAKSEGNELLSSLAPTNIENPIEHSSDGDILLHRQLFFTYFLVLIHSELKLSPAHSLVMPILSLSTFNNSRYHSNAHTTRSFSQFFSSLARLCFFFKTNQ